MTVRSEALLSFQISAIGLAEINLSGLISLSNFIDILIYFY